MFHRRLLNHILNLITHVSIVLLQGTEILELGGTKNNSSMVLISQYCDQ